MGIEGQFAGISALARPQPAFVRDGRGKGYLDDIRRFAMLERDQEYRLARRWRASTATVTPRTSLLQVICVSPPKSPWDTAATASDFGNHLRRQCWPDAGIEPL